MKMKNFAGVLMAGLVMVTTTPGGPDLVAQERGETITPPKFFGSVNYEVRPHVTRARLIVSVTQNNNIVSGLNVKLFNTLARLEGNAYRCLIEPFSAQPGTPVTVSFLSPTSPVKKPLIATAFMEPPPVIRSPALDSQIDLDSSQLLIIHWSGGTPPYSLSVVEIIGESTPSSMAFQQSGITSTQISVPASQLNPGKKYAIILSGNPVAFSFDGPTDPGTNFRLVPSVGTQFYTKPQR
jgi:hypothetical protein